MDTKAIRLEIRSLKSQLDLLEMLVDKTNKLIYTMQENLLDLQDQKLAEYSRYK